MLENRIRGLVAIDYMQFGFKPEKGTTRALFILRRIRKEFRGKEKKLHMCYVDFRPGYAIKKKNA